jgi:hypothetical protein
MWFLVKDLNFHYIFKHLGISNSKVECALRVDPMKQIIR